MDGKIKEVKSTAPVTVGRMTYIQLNLRDVTTNATVPTRFRMTEDVELGTSSRVARPPPSPHPGHQPPTSKQTCRMPHLVHRRSAHFAVLDAATPGVLVSSLILTLQHSAFGGRGAIHVLVPECCGHVRVHASQHV